MFGLILFAVYMLGKKMSSTIDADDTGRELPTISEVEDCAVCLEEESDLPVTSCCGQTIHLTCFDICLKSNKRCPYCRCGMERSRVLQNRSIYVKILHEVGRKRTRKIHQDKMGFFYLDLAKVLCTVGCKSAVVRVKLGCGMNGFLEVIKSISNVELLEEEETEF